MVLDEAFSCKVDLSTAIQEIWNQLDGEYYFSLVKNVSQRIQVIIKAQILLLFPFYASKNFSLFDLKKLSY